MKKPFNKHYLRSLTSRLKKKGWLADILEFDWEHFDKNTYLIRYGHNDGYNVGRQPLLLMGDFGITWEPAKAYSTEVFAIITGDDPDADVETMIKIGRKYFASTDPYLKDMTITCQTTTP